MHLIHESPSVIATCHIVFIVSQKLSECSRLDYR